MRQFLKQFKHSNSSVRILKISPYCDAVFKNKLLSALGNSHKQSQANPQGQSPIKGQWDSELRTKKEHSHQPFASRGKFFRKYDSSERKGSQLLSIDTIIINFEHEEFELFLSEEMCQEGKYLLPAKILEEFTGTYENHRKFSKFNTFVGFNVVGFKAQSRGRETSELRSPKRGEFKDRISY